ncbi:hypothetical protein CARUB_v10000679mg [Capsella rubella]|uniref:PLAC8 family protein n=1 Tax=Capsella rubella TaxID=81985 RepID=R0H6C7_9BRAS|nr:uncharacterized protein LOC17882305 [Capsella rubella]EOA20365.1 hypothetical protein CARUB_v10000679mg [Capsella rubella]
MGLNDKIEGSDDSCKKARVSCPPGLSISDNALFSEEKPRRWSESSLPDVSNRVKLLKFGSPSARFKRMTAERDEVSRSVNSSSNHNLRERISVMFSRKIEWACLMKMGKQWLRDPFNMALFLWILVVAVSGAILFMVMTGMLNHALPKKSQRDVWFEVNNQILNALFTLMCLYQHPKRFYHLVLLCRWNQDDVTTLRKIYCENGTYKPNEWIHMMVVVLLLHLNCFAQYGLCGLNLGYTRSERPAIGVAICISIAIAAPAAAGLYTILSPLGKDYHPQADEENQVQPAEGPFTNRKLSLERRYSFAYTDVSNPEWRGGVLDIWEDISLAYLSLFCTFCVFGWNMERIGFGNMYVHIATFILFCLAPFFIFNLAAINIDNEMVREALGYTGIVLCLFGLLYGGFWRIQMRKRFKLPSYNFCCGRPAIADCTLWLFCCWCSLAQEVRTANSYEIVEDQFCKRREEDSKIDDEVVVSSSPREDGVYDPSCSPKKMAATIAGSSLSPSRSKDETCLGDKSDGALSPPSPPFIDREAS